MRKKLLFAVFAMLFGLAGTAQNVGGDTLALFDFNNPATPVVTGTSSFHTQTAYASTWHRIAGPTYVESAELQNLYPDCVGYYTGYLTYYMDSSFMLMSLWDSTLYGAHYEAWFELGPIDASQVPLVEVRMQQLYRKYYDSCFVDYTDASGAWHSMQINVTGVDLDVNSWGAISYTFTLPVDAANNAQLKLRFRYKDRYWTGASGYFWAIDNVAVCRGRANNLELLGEHYVEGFYGQIPQGLQTPLSWWMQVKNRGSLIHTNVTTSLLHYGATGSNSDLITAVSQYDLYPGIYPNYYFIEGLDNIAVNDGDHSYSSYYGQPNAPQNNNGLVTTVPGKNFVQAHFATDSASMYYSRHLYNVTTPAADGAYTWGQDNGLLLSGNTYQDGFVYNSSYNAWYNTDASDNYNQTNYRVLNRYTTGSTVPVDSLGRPWVIRGVEVVPAAGANTSQYAGAVLAAEVRREYVYGDGEWVWDILGTGDAPHTVQMSELNLQEGAFENGYNTVRIMFPQQVELEPNVSYFAGFRLENDHEFAAAKTATSWMDSSQTWHSIYNDSLLSDYASRVGNTYYTAYAYDPVRDGWNSYTGSQAMVRLLVGPRTEVAQHTLAINMYEDHGGNNIIGGGGYVNMNGSSHYGSPSFSFAEGSYVTGMFVPDYGNLLDSANISVTGNAVIYKEDGYWWFRIDSLSSDVTINVGFTVNAVCHKQAPYSISQGQNWIADCWETWNSDDSTRVYFSNTISSPWFNLSDSASTYVINFTVDNTATGVDELVVYIIDGNNNYYTNLGFWLSNPTINQFSFNISDPQLAGNTIRLQFYFPANSDYLMTLTDFAIFPFDGSVNIVQSVDPVHAGESFTLTIHADDGQGHPADSYYLQGWNDGENYEFQDSWTNPAQFQFNETGIHTFYYYVTWNNVWNGYSASLDGNYIIDVLEGIPGGDTAYVYIHDTIYLYGGDTAYIRDTVYINNPAYQDSVIYNIIYQDSVITNIIQRDSVITNIIQRDSVVYNVSYRDTVVVNVVQRDSIIYVFDTNVITHDTIWMVDTVTIHDTIYITEGGIDSVETLNAMVYADQGQIVVEGAEGNTVRMFDVVGRLMATKRDDYTLLRFDVPVSGTYMIKIGNYPARKVVVIR